MALRRRFRYSDAHGRLRFKSDSLDRAGCWKFYESNRKKRHFEIREICLQQISYLFKKKYFQRNVY